MRSSTADAFVQFHRTHYGAQRRRVVVGVVDTSDRHDEPVARPRHRFDVRGRPLLVAECSTQRRDVNGENALFDERVRPDPRQQFVLGDEAARVPQQCDQHVERLWREADDVNASLQPALLDIQGEFAEMKDFPVAHRFRPI